MSINKISAAIDASALYSKSQLYIGRGLRAKEAGDTEEYQLWASLALELLSKAALAKVHPALVADPTDFNSLLAACGKTVTPDIRTIAAKTVFSRLPQFAPDFDARYKEFCEQIAIRRNCELHSGDSPFSGMRAEAWEMEFWGAIQVILHSQDRNLELWLGIEGAKQSSAIIEKAKEALDWAVKNRVKRAKEDFEDKVKNPKDRRKLIENSERREWYETGGSHAYSHFEGHERHVCPACGASAFLAGMFLEEEIVDSYDGWSGGEEDQSDGEPPWEKVEQTYRVDWLICPICKLELHGGRENRAAGVPEEFKKIEERVQEYEPDYGND